MLDLGRAQVAMGSGSLEYEREGKAIRLPATLRRSESLGQGPPDGVAVVAREADGPVAIELDDARFTNLSRWSPSVLL